MRMLSIPLLFLQLFIPIATSLHAPAYVPVDIILLNCGSPALAVDTSGRTWEGDEPSKYFSANTSNAYQATHMDTSLLDRVPYQTARIFHSQFKYSFPVVRTGTIIRLYFYPSTYGGFDPSLFSFSVTANSYTLLSNFSGLLNSWSLRQPSFIKEFIIVVEQKRVIELTFSPNPKSFAFINGIEIVSFPDDLYFRNTLIQFRVVSALETDPGLETLYRLNVGGPDVQKQDDSGMFRYWSSDDEYIFGPDYGYTPYDEDHVVNYTTNTPAYSAPRIVYRTSRTMANTSISLKWAFPVDSGFHYLLRLHFCEIKLEVTKPNDRVFTININDQTAENRADIISWTGSTGIPIFKDYTTNIPDDGRRGKKDLRLSLFPTAEGLPKYYSALLNGLEVFKLSDSNQSLASANPEPPSPGNEASHVMFKAIGSVIGVLAVIAMASFLVSRWPVSRKPSMLPLLTTLRPKKRSSGSGMSLLSYSCKHFSLKDIKAATGDFDDNFVIGQGGFGKVYKGFIHHSATTIAAKRLRTSSNQGAQEFQTEIELLSKLRHLHLVSLIGYCNESGEMILVYDYMAHGTLRDHLYNSNNPPLAWKRRLEICLGAAKGLNYLHAGTKHTIIHRDVKSTNILLDEKWVAKMSDFGLSKIGPSDTSNTHVSTVVKGSFGYIDPEYYKLRQLTEKSDVYSFGVVLFEVLCARPAVLPGLPEPDDQVNLAEWAKLCYQEGTIEQIVDSNVKCQIASECLDKFVETAIQCLSSNRSRRPSMSEVVRNLEVTMQLQEAADGRAGDCPDGFRSSNAAIELSSGAWEIMSTSKKGGLQCMELFSDLANPSGR